MIERRIDPDQSKLLVVQSRRITNSPTSAEVSFEATLRGESMAAPVWRRRVA
jgi:hypothetical protein